jgi:hypothetical protein
MDCVAHPPIHNANPQILRKAMRHSSPLRTAGRSSSNRMPVDPARPEIDLRDGRYREQSGEAVGSLRRTLALRAHAHTSTTAGTSPRPPESTGVKLCSWLAALGLAAAAVPARAGPPYLTDDPVPTDTDHWEIYAFAAGEGRHSTVDEDIGLDLNYGPATNIQLTATLPFSFSHAPLEGWRSGTGDVELGLKYRFLRDEKRGVSASIFPRAILPTAAHSPGEKTRFLLPLWLGKDFGGSTSLFGGGGYMINPGSGNRNFWQGAIALTHDLSKEVSVGAEVTRQGPDAVGATSQTRFGVGSIVHIAGPASLLMSGGPTWADHRTGYHFYGAVGIDF